MKRRRSVLLGASLLASCLAMILPPCRWTRPSQQRGGGASTAPHRHAELVSASMNTESEDYLRRRCSWLLTFVRMTPFLGRHLEPLRHDIPFGRALAAGRGLGVLDGGEAALELGDEIGIGAAGEHLGDEGAAGGEDA